MKLSFIAPCYNEKDNIALLYNRISQVFCDTDYEILFIDDGSTDGTINELKKLYNKDKKRVRIIEFSRNFGKEAAMYAGLQHANGDIISIIDADMQQNPSVVADMVKILQDESDIDCVCACQVNRHENGFIKGMKSLFYKTANRFTDIEFIDGASDFRTFRRGVRDAILSVNDYFRFSKGIFSWIGFNTKYIEYTAQDRANGVSKWNFSKLLKYALDGIVAFSTAPLQFATIVGSLATVFSIIYFFVTIIRKFVADISVDGFTQIVILIAFFGGVQLFTIGIIGKYLAKNYIETKRRPIYIAREIIGCNNKEDDK